MSNSMPRLLHTTVMWALIWMFAVPIGPASSAQIKLIRDAEIEHSIRNWVTPLFSAAGLTSGAVRIHIVADRNLNAFVAGGQNIFVNTGLLMSAESVNEIVGVLAHETGHIAGGHLVRLRDAMENANAQAIVAMVLGIAAIVAGQGDVGGAVFSGGQQVAKGALLKYNRTQESVADQMALKFLRDTGQSPAGILTFLERMRGQEALVTANQDPYIRSHPLTRDRIAALRTVVEQSGPPPADVEANQRLARLQAKIFAFFETPSRTLRKYPETDTSVPARFARAVAHHRDSNLPSARREIDILLNAFPDDPYFHELKGQILFEQGHAGEAVAPLRRANELMPNEPLLLMALGQAQIATADPALVHDAIAYLEVAVSLERDLASAWRQLAIALGRDGQIAKSSLASAEYALLTGRPLDARMFARRALDQMPQGSTGRIRALDIQRSVDRELKKRAKRQ